MKGHTREHDVPVPENLTKRSVLLTLLYLVLWALGPLLFGDQSANMIAGLPLWFWFSCVMAPLLLVATSYIVFFKR